MCVSTLACFLCLNVKHGGFSLSQLYPYTEDTGVLIGAKRQDGLVASLADIAWIDRDEDDDDEDFSGRPR